MKRLFAYMKKMFQKVEQEEVAPLRKAQIITFSNPLDVYDEDISDRVGHVNFNKLRRLKESGAQTTRDFYNDDGDLID